ncbi:LysR family transcriptional regulator [Novosphingobium taihuense]|uniref:DNA-binding transcriptional LysR family regulator n=1 Tax=Novosphingobium taihuense TaxID=260085 RepID=A0A7W7ABZ4_9SPHN|nr:LysR family transcriptional regulator [Novosphingobium taihuense]MBB4613514.1 DNA-binding transcriptional LysR family regulator [Novosphingobium taihuense]TWH79993.1 LysR family transcriptional regulator [Novosphingobium taihuense]
MKRAHLRQFLALVETGNFTRAAERLGVAQPTLSSAIAELERLAGTRLFMRDKRQVRLTEAGARLVTHARAIEREFRAAEAVFADAPVPLSPLRLGMLPSVATHMISGMVRGFTGPQPLMLSEGTDAELRRKLGEGQVDVIITILRPEDTDRPSLALMEEGYRLLMPEGHALAGAALLDARDVAAETMIARRSCEILGETSRWFTQRGVRPPFFLRSSNDDRCIEMVRAGMGVTTAPQSLVREGVVAVPLAEYDFRRTLGLVAARERPDLVDEGSALVEAARAALN